MVWITPHRPCFRIPSKFAVNYSVMSSDPCNYQRYYILAMFAASAVSGPLYPGQSGPFAMPDSIDDAPAAAYTPGPNLSPSTLRLVFSAMLPGESRTLFMDLANLGAGIIDLDSVAFQREFVEVALAPQQLRPGQFVRFPVTFTQTDLKTRELKLELYWHSASFGTADILPLALTATPRAPLAAIPPQISWDRVYVGSRQSYGLLLQNLGSLPITFPAPVEAPQGVRAQLPTVVASHGSASIVVTWLPRQAGRFSGSLNLPYATDGIVGQLSVPLAGEVVQPAYLLVDTLDFGQVFAGSAYRRSIGVANGSPYAVVLQRRSGDNAQTLPGGNRVGWTTTPAQLVVKPGRQIDLEVMFSPALAGPYLVQIPFQQQLLPASNQPSDALPELALTVRAEVRLPLQTPAVRIDFGPQPVLLTAHRPLALANLGAEQLSVSLELDLADPAFSIPPLAFSLAPGARLEVPLYFRPIRMQNYFDTVVLRYATFGRPHELRIDVSGSGSDRPLVRTAVIPDVTLQEDFQGWVPIADLEATFDDANHGVSYQVRHPFGDHVQLLLLDGRVLAATTPDYHGAAQVVVRATNELGHVVSDTFRLSIAPVNDLPRRGTPLPDIVLNEDAPAMVVGVLADIFVDPDHVLDTVRTDYAIFSSGDDDGIVLVMAGGELHLSVAPDWYGSRSFVISARDAADTSVLVFDSFKVTVLSENDAPTLGSLQPLHLAEDDTAVIAWAPLMADVDDPVETLRLDFSNAGPGALPVTFEPVGGHTTVLRLRRDWFGRAKVRVTVTDPQGATASGDFTVTVSPENDPPGPFVLTGPVTLDWDQRLQYAGRDTLITFAWEPSQNRDPGDNLLYTWQLLDSSGQRVIKEQPAGPFTSVTAYFDTSGIFYWAVLVRDSEGAVATTDTVPIILESSQAPLAPELGRLTLSLGPNFPNPFSYRTRISYAIPRYSEVALTIYDAVGRLVRVLRDAPQYRGRYVAEWDGRDQRGQRVASGPYVAELRVGTITAYLKLVVVH